MAKLGTSRNPGEARALPPTLQMKIGRALQSYLSELRNVFPEVNPVGEAIEDFFLEPSEQMTADMAAGNPYAVIDPRPNTRNINPAVVDTAALLPVASVAKIAATPAAAATATGMGLLGLQMGGLGARRGLLGDPTLRFAGPGRPQRGAIVYHGSPYKFDRFDFSHIGKGEGAQAFGHGGYMTDSPELGNWYSTKLGERSVASEGDESFDVASYLGDDIGDHAADRAAQIHHRGNEIDYVFDDGSILRMDSAGNVQPFGKPQGYLYKADLPDTEIEKMLDFDVPLGQQDPNVRKKLKALSNEITVDDAINLGFDPFDYGNDQQKAIDLAKRAILNDDETPLSFLNNWTSLRGSESAGEELLKKHGIPGIKYYDGMSRAAGAGTRNYVVFDDQLATILSRNGQPINPPGAQSMWSPEALKRAADQNWKSRDILIEMTPQDFLRMANDFGVPDATKTKRIAEARAAGTQMDSVPVLSFDNVGGGKAKVVGHEGRHRALRAIEEGEETIPVLLNSGEGGAAQAIRWGSQEPGTYDWVEDFPTVLEGQGNKTNQIPFPARRHEYVIAQGSPLGAQPIARGQRGAVGPLRDYDAENNLIGEDDGLLSNIESSIAPIKLPRGRGKDLSEAKRELKAAELELKNWRSMTPNEQQKYAKERGQKLSRADNSIKDRAKQARKNVNALENMRETKSTVPGAKRVGYPGVYKKPSQLAAESEARVAPENPAMQRLFGVNRDDLFEMNKTRVGPQSQLLKRPASGRVPTSEATDAVMSPENTARLLENIDVAKKEAPGLTKGMLPWYVMDPVFERQVELLGYDEAVRLFNQMQSMTGMTSPNSGVAMEIARGLGANYLYEKNRLDDFIKYGGIAEKNRNRVSDFPPDMMDIPGHMTHSTAHAKPMKKFLDAGGVVDMDSVKVPSYIEAAGVPGHPNIPFQTRTPVGDAHFARGIGLADARAGGDWGKSITSPELRAIEDWWYTDIAQPSGIEGVPAQALSWGLYAPQTGVKTDIGAGKLELLSEHIMRRAKQTGVTPEEMRDLILSGKAYGLGATGLLGGLLSESLYQPETSM